MRISYSSLEAYKNCPLKFKLSILDKIKAPKSIDAVFGTAVHSSLKRMFEKKPLFPALDEVLDHFRNSWDVPDESPEVAKMLMEDGLSLIQSFYKKNPPWNFNPVELESFFQIALEDPETKEQHALTGKMDRIDKLAEDGAYEIIDYKTGKRMPSKDAVDADLQLSIYNMGLLKKWPHLLPEKIKLSLYFLKHNQKIETTRTVKDLEKTKIEILKIIREIDDLQKNKKEFIPTPSALCDWCGYKKMCPMWRHMYAGEENQNTKSEEEIKKLLNEYFDIKARSLQNKRRISEINAQIGEFMDKTAVDRVFGEEGFITRVLQEKTAYNMPLIREIFEKLGKWQDVVSKKQYTILKASKKKLKK